MADHPLRPATDHRLGRPLPHQLANPTRAPPAAINLSRPSLSRQPAYAVLAEVSLGYPPQQGRFPRATHPCATRGRNPAFDLHVLGMPPAFVLSQDQTLKFIPDLLFYSKVDPNKGLQTFASMRELLTALGRRPRIPSLFSTISISIPKGQPTRPAPKGPRLYAPHATRVNTRFTSSIDSATLASTARPALPLTPLSGPRIPALSRGKPTKITKTEQASNRIGPII